MMTFSFEIIYGPKILFEDRIFFKFFSSKYKQSLMEKWLQAKVLDLGYTLSVPL